jgi:hypothetical protein
MKSLWIKTLLLTGALALQSHAILGLGLHWAPAPGVEVAGSTGSIMPSGSSDPDRIVLMTGSASGLQGFGAKFWIDFLPLVDVEATANVQFGYYDAAFIDNGGTTPDTIPLNFDLGIPGAEGKPFYARSTGDVAILYPFFKIPLLKLSAGGGLSYIMATQTMSAKFARGALEDAEDAGGFDPDNATQDEITEVIVEAIKDEGMVTGIGFFVQVGAKIKPPIIPIALYGDLKYNFAGPDIDGVDGPGLTAELGAALAF